ncbi:MAG: hypothetical protein C5B49_06600 [Bdellovibrio sp.]|nr:MAG: hypothetical protein C5B49_06600 [Bdellovibrio sp.]
MYLFPLLLHFSALPNSAWANEPNRCGVEINPVVIDFGAQSVEQWKQELAENKAALASIQSNPLPSGLSNDGLKVIVAALLAYNAYFSTRMAQEGTKLHYSAQEMRDKLKVLTDTYDGYFKELKFSRAAQGAIDAEIQALENARLNDLKKLPIDKDHTSEAIEFAKEKMAPSGYFSHTSPAAQKHVAAFYNKKIAELETAKAKISVPTLPPGTEVPYEYDRQYSGEKRRLADRAI